jgi:hypothetical protein
VPICLDQPCVGRARDGTWHIVAALGDPPASSAWREPPQYIYSMHVHTSRTGEISNSSMVPEILNPMHCRRAIYGAPSTVAPSHYHYVLTRIRTGLFLLCKAGRIYRLTDATYVQSTFETVNLNTGTTRIGSSSVPTALDMDQFE